jgi:hypothetical protein
VPKDFVKKAVEFGANKIADSTGQHEIVHAIKGAIHQKIDDHYDNPEW